MTDSDNCQTPAVEVAYIFLFLAGVTLFSHLSQFKVARALAENPIYTDSALSVSNWDGTDGASRRFSCSTVLFGVGRNSGNVDHS